MYKRCYNGKVSSAVLCFLAIVAETYRAFFLAFFLAFSATDKAMATACFCGFPDFISLDMFFEMVFCEYPFFSMSQR